MERERVLRRGFHRAARPFFIFLREGELIYLLVMLLPALSLLRWFSCSQSRHVAGCYHEPTRLTLWMEKPRPAKRICRPRVSSAGFGKEEPSRPFTCLGRGWIRCCRSLCSFRWGYIPSYMPFLRGAYRYARLDASFFSSSHPSLYPTNVHESTSRFRQREWWEASPCFFWVVISHELGGYLDPPPPIGKKRATLANQVGEITRFSLPSLIYQNLTDKSRRYLYFAINAKISMQL